MMSFDTPTPSQIAQKSDFCDFLKKYWNLPEKNDFEQFSAQMNSKFSLRVGFSALSLLKSLVFSGLQDEISARKMFNSLDR